MTRWYTFARCASATTIAVLAPSTPAAAETLAYPVAVSGVVAAGYDPCVPCPPVVCPPDPCATGELGYPADTPSAAPTPAVEAEADTEGDLQIPDAPTATPAPVADAAPTPTLDFAPALPSGGAGFASPSAVAFAADGGYIDSARVRTRARIRYDNLQGANEPSRAEFFYPTPAGTFTDAKGPDIVGIANANELDLEELSFYFEVLLTERMSGFIDAPIRWISELDLDNDGTASVVDGFSDLRTGVRYAIVDCCDRHLTAQILISTPTGDAKQALGTGNTSFDIGLLFDRRLSDDVVFFGEFRDFFTLNAPTVIDGAANEVDLNSNVLRVGVGVGVDLIEFGSCCKPKTLTGLFEVVTWTVLDGFSTDIFNSPGIARDAEGDTIVNGKYGVRYQNGRQTAYLGYGHNWSSDRWYADIVRFEWGLDF
ncbi:MAG: hypothetical protein AAF805_07655 [Planctomycetota bacterium]